ncbi:TetR family transcriptional regulator C-terminal domain-containing protein [Flavobacterium difficile]|uniref:TetR/AcrR family transcriptional regulator n=1 Tax=Flavobacterium difficile TaxID=2709659 RepID=A0ABX0I4Q3_9FLAO|nr:TetR family transcriptional regulator C-terminal domain-containing protein [Flavobacterium difficile]NHM00732.1 TetR/AcrR family transcriptional regulator [Flavobacterium difficile]
MAAPKKKKTISEDLIVSAYTDYCLTHGKKPNSVYEFAKLNGMDESDFYQFFASFEFLEKQYFVSMFTYTLELLEKNEAFQTYDSANKLSAFYFTFFEMATANRSFIMHLLKENKNAMKNLGKLSKLREVYLDYALTVLDKPIKIEQETVVKIQDKVLQEASWLQFLSIFNFWMKDESANFEKTDIFIEKSVKASFDLAYNIPTQSIVDFGKFLWKEQMNGMFSKS